MSKAIPDAPHASVLDGSEMIPCVQGSTDRHLLVSDITDYAKTVIGLVNVMSISQHTGNSPIIADYATASRVPVFNASKELVASLVSSAELGFLLGTSSNIQTQIDSMVSLVNSLNTTVTNLNNSFQKMPTKVNCLVCSTANVNIAGPGGVINGVAINPGDRVLLAFQTDPKENGIYEVQLTGTLGYASDFQAPFKVAGCIVAVDQGTKYADTLWQCTNDEPVNFGADNIVFEEIDSVLSATNPGATTVGAPGHYYGDPSVNGLGEPDAGWLNIVLPNGNTILVPAYNP